MGTPWVLTMARLCTAAQDLPALTRTLPALNAQSLSAPLHTAPPPLRGACIMGLLSLIHCSRVCSIITPPPPCSTTLQHLPALQSACITIRRVTESEHLYNTNTQMYLQVIM